MEKVSKRLVEEKSESTDPETRDFMLKCSERLDQLLGECYEFVECQEEQHAPEITPAEVDPRLAFHFLICSEGGNDADINTKKKPVILRHKFEEVSKEDLAAIAVNSEWVLNKKGVYNTGRERRSELMTGATHSPILKRLLTNNQQKQKCVT